MKRFKNGLVLWLALVIGSVAMAIAASVPRMIDSFLPATQAHMNAIHPISHESSLVLDCEFPGMLDSTRTLCRFDNPLVTHEHIAHFTRQAKIQCAQATLHLVEGRRDDALALILSACQASQNVINDLPDHDAVHAAIMVKALAVRLLELFMLNAVETPDDAAHASVMLAMLAESSRPLDSQISQTIEPPCGSDSSGQVNVSNNLLIPYQTACIRLQLLRLAVAARHYQLVNGQFPDNAAALFPLIPGALPADPMSGCLLNLFVKDDEFVVYAAGPDGDDDGASRDYDPRRGWISDGDIIVRMPAARRFAFPREPLCLTSAAELMALYPDGLPPDVFSEQPNRPLLVASSDPVVVFSRGPEALFSWDFDKLNPQNPGVIYDPTNGLLSRGRLAVTIPLPE